jgi:Flp pilus assembly protein TadD
VRRCAPAPAAIFAALALTVVPRPAAADLAPPDYATYHAQRAYRDALVALSLGENETALDAARDAVALTPEDPQAQYLLGISLLFNEQYERAGETLAMVVELDPDLPEAVHDLGLVRLHLGQGEEAALAFQQVSQMMPDSWVGPYRAAQTAALLYRDWAACEQFLREAMQRGFPWVASLPVDPEWAAVAEDPAFLAVVEGLLGESG